MTEVEIETSSTKALTRIPKPDKNIFEADLAKVNDEIKKLQVRTNEIREEMDKIQSGRGGMSEQIQSEKLIFNEIRSEKDALLKERNKISTELKSHQAKKDQQTKSQKALRQEIKYTTSEEIDEQISKLRYRQETSSMSLTEEKNLVKEIENLQASKKLVSKFANEKNAIDKCRGNIKEIRLLYDKKNSQIDKVQERLNVQKKNIG